MKKKIEAIIQKLRELLPKAKPAPKPKPKVKPQPAPRPVVPVTMYDSTEVLTIPGAAEAVAGYVGGNWPTYNTLVKKYPHAKHVSIAVNSQEDAICLDIENGDATAEDAPGWYRRQKSRHVTYPKLYTSASNVGNVVTKMHAAGIGRSGYRIWSAHYGRGKHICGPKSCGYPQADATQWTDKALNRNLDESICNPSFFD